MLAEKLKSLSPSFKKCALLRDVWHVHLGERKIGSILLRCGKWHYEKDGKLYPPKGLVSRNDAVKELIRLDDGMPKK